VSLLKELVLKNRRLTIQEVADVLRISFCSVQSILQDNLKVIQTAAKFMSGLLSEEQRENLVNMCQNLQETLKETKNFHMPYLFSQNLKWHSREGNSISP
jgi:predicted PolB exonuclease-like 3'-5' exonuclease